MSSHEGKENTNRLVLIPGTASWVYPSNLYYLSFTMMEWFLLKYCCIAKNVTKDPSQKAHLLKLLIIRLNHLTFLLPSWDSYAERVRILIWKEGKAGNLEAWVILRDIKSSRRGKENMTETNMYWKFTLCQVSC